MRNLMIIGALSLTLAHAAPEKPTPTEALKDDKSLTIESLEKVSKAGPLVGRDKAIESCKTQLSNLERYLDQVKGDADNEALYELFMDRIKAEVRYLGRKTNSYGARRSVRNCDGDARRAQRVLGKMGVRTAVEGKDAAVPAPEAPSAPAAAKEAAGAKEVAADKGAAKKS